MNLRLTRRAVLAVTHSLPVGAVVNNKIDMLKDNVPTMDNATADYEAAKEKYLKRVSLKTYGFLVFKIFYLVS